MLRSKKLMSSFYFPRRSNTLNRECHAKLRKCRIIIKFPPGDDLAKRGKSAMYLCLLRKLAISQFLSNDPALLWAQNKLHRVIIVTHIDSMNFPFQSVDFCTQKRKVFMFGSVPKNIFHSPVALFIPVLLFLPVLLPWKQLVEHENSPSTRKWFSWVLAMAFPCLAFCYISLDEVMKNRYESAAADNDSERF